MSMVDYVLQKLMGAQLGGASVPNETKAHHAAEVAVWMATDAYKEGQIAMRERVMDVLRMRRNEATGGAISGLLLMDDVDSLLPEEPR